MPDTGQTLLMKSTKLRHKWEFLLNERLKGIIKKLKRITSLLIRILFLDSETPNNMFNIRKIEHELTQELIDYMHTTVPYVIKRLLLADLKAIYVGNGNNVVHIDPNPFKLDFKPICNSVKGGMYLTDNITYNW